jgi:crotonobetainyl-CoA:carnitine CoA-transferase CaiB-like acyl-CoA transferase
MGIPIANYLGNGKLPKRQGSGTSQIVPYQAFRTSDGWIMVLAGNDNLFRRMCDAIGLPALAEDERFRSNSGRVVNRESLIPILQDAIAGLATAALREKLDAVGVPNGPIQTADQVVTDPQTEALGILQRSPDGELTLIGMPLSFDGQRPPFETRAPMLAQHQEEVLGKRKKKS